MPSQNTLALQSKDKVKLTLLAGGTVIKRAKQRSILDLHGLLHYPDRKPIPIINMSSWK